MTNDQAFALALDALSWILSDDARAQRLMALTGLSPTDLRARLDQPRVLAAILGFLLTHEPDLVACAEALDVAPSTLVSAHQLLERA